MRQLLFSIALAVSVAVPVKVAGQEPVTYELFRGSQLTEECLPCGARPTVVPIEGTFTVRELIVGAQGRHFAIEAVDLHCRKCPVGISFEVEGTGSYSLPGPAEQDALWTLTVNGVEGIALTSASQGSPMPFPVLRLLLTESGERDPLSRITLAIFAAPRSDTSRSFVLEPGRINSGTGTILHRICETCELITPQVPLEGTFLLSPTTSDRAGSTLYIIREFEARSTLIDFKATVLGDGFLRIDDDPPARVLALEVSVGDGEEAALLTMDPQPLPPGADPLQLTLDLRQVDPHPTIWYTLSLVAGPAGVATPRFRRGDSNSDASVNLSDAVHILLWKFSGGEAPGCEEAADTNADKRVDLTDAVSLLEYLFRGGPEPPLPGPHECGTPQALPVGCADEGPCRG